MEALSFVAATIYTRSPSSPLRDALIMLQMLCCPRVRSLLIMVRRAPKLLRAEFLVDPVRKAEPAPGIQRVRVKILSLKRECRLWPLRVTCPVLLKITLVRLSAAVKEQILVFGLLLVRR